MAVEIIGNSENVRKYREYLHRQGVLTKRFIDSAQRRGQPIIEKPEGYRIINGGIKNVYNVKTVKGIPREVKSLDPMQKLYIKGIANANMVDRMDERLEPAGIDINNFMKNQVLLLDHLYIASATIGRVVNLDAQDSGIHFEAYIGDPAKAELTGQQKDARSLIAQKLLQTVSVGFIPHKVKAPEFDEQGRLMEPAVILQWELLELSVVAVPANAGSVFTVSNLSLEEPVQRSALFTSIPKEATIEKSKHSDDDDTTQDNETSYNATTLAKDEKLMEEKLVEMIEQMKRIGSMLGSMNDMMMEMKNQNDMMMEMMAKKMSEGEQQIEDAEPGKEEELKYDKEKEKEKEEMKALKTLITCQNEKIEQISAIMLNIISNNDHSNR